MTKRESALCALVHLDAVADHYQALHALKLNEPINRTVILAQKVNRSIADDTRMAGGIKDEQASVFLPAYPTSMHKHLKPRESYRHIR